MTSYGIFSLQLTYRGYPPSKRQWNGYIKHVFERVGLEWHQQFYDHHFTHEGARDYGYIKRKGELQTDKKFGRSYTGRKKAKYGHTLPLRFSSLSYNLGKVAKVQATSKGGKVVLPQGYNRKHPKTQINMRDEVTRVLPREMDHLRRIADLALQQQIDSGRNNP
jgi:hypothetical protein